MKTLFYLSSILLLLIPSSSHAQKIPGLAVEIEGWIMEKKKDNRETGVGGIDIWIRFKENDSSPMTTDPRGAFSFLTPRDQEYVHIEIPKDKFAILEPLNGDVNMTQTLDSRLVKVMVVSQEENEELHRKIRVLTSRVLQLNLDRKRKDRLFGAMRDSIVSLTAQNQALLQRIGDLEDELNQSTSENQDLRETVRLLERELQQQRSRNEVLQDSLFIALEARYLRQQEFYGKIESDLQSYLRKVEDMRDQGEKMKVYLKNNNISNYKHMSTEYQKVADRINENHLSMIEAVNHYWKDKGRTYLLESTYEYVIHEIHKKEVLLPFNELNQYIRAGKPNKAIKKGEEIHKKLSIEIPDLEKKIERVLDAL